MAPSSDDNRPSCFIAMPITVHENEAEIYRDALHWAHVMDVLFIPAIEKAGFKPIKPSAEGTSMIHGRIVKHLVEADLVLCDLSQHNPNVLFELGVRTSINRPVALVKDEHLGLPFDVSVLNIYEYNCALPSWDLDRDIDRLAEHIRTTASDAAGVNPLWRHFGVDAIASAPDVDATPTDARIEMILERVEALSHDMARQKRASPSSITGTQQNLQAIVAGEAMMVSGVINVELLPTLDGRQLITILTTDATHKEQLGRAREVLRRIHSVGIAAEVERTGANVIDLRVPDLT